MRVQKFRTIEEMNRAAAERPASVDIERFLRHCARYRAIAHREFPRGVFKFHSIEEAEAARARPPVQDLP